MNEGERREGESCISLINKQEVIRSRRIRFLVNWIKKPSSKKKEVEKEESWYSFRNRKSWAPEVMKDPSRFSLPSLTLLSSNSLSSLSPSSFSYWISFHFHPFFPFIAIVPSLDKWSVKRQWSETQCGSWISDKDRTSVDNTWTFMLIFIPSDPAIVNYNDFFHYNDSFSILSFFLSSSLFPLTPFPKQFVFLYTSWSRKEKHWIACQCLHQVCCCSCSFFLNPFLLSCSVLSPFYQNKDVDTEKERSFDSFLPLKPPLVMFFLRAWSLNTERKRWTEKKKDRK